MKLEEMLSTARDAITIQKVYAEPYEKDGTTVIPAAVMSGGGGGGQGHEKDQEGEGAGFGVRLKPTGAFVLRNGEVQWRPAVDVNRLVAVVGAVMVAWLLSRLPIRAARRRARRGGRMRAMRKS